MNLTKAIELNNESEKSLRKHKFPDHANAVKMGNEAIKRLELYRQDTSAQHFELLPGETKE